MFVQCSNKSSYQIVIVIKSQLANTTTGSSKNNLSRISGASIADDSNWKNNVRDVDDRESGETFKRKHAPGHL